MVWGGVGWFVCCFFYRVWGDYFSQLLFLFCLFVFKYVFKFSTYGRIPSSMSRRGLLTLGHTHTGFPPSWRPCVGHSAAKGVSLGGQVGLAAVSEC